MASMYGAQVLSFVNGFFPFFGAGELSQVMPCNGGTFTATGSAVTVANANVTANSQILITLKTAGGTVSSQFVQTITPGTGFTVNGGASDTSVYNYMIIG